MTANPNFLYLKRTVPKQRITLLQGGTRSGKTWSTVDYLIWLCMNHKGMDIDITRETFKALKATAWKDFKSRLMEFGLYNPNDHNKTDGIYTLNENTINYFGSDDHGKVHGKSRHILWVNEAQLADEEVIDQLFPRTTHRIICDFNPALGDEHWLDRYIGEYPPLITTYRDNPHLSKEQVADIESRKDNPYWWSIYGSGQRAKVEGAVFSRWERGVFPTEITDYWFGLDFGWSKDPSALVRVYIDKRERIIYMKEEVYQTHLGTSDLGELCKWICERRLIVADSAEPRLIEEIRRQRVNIQPVKKGSVAEGVTMMNDYKIVAEGDNLCKELSKYRWADKGRTVPIDDYNHALDAARYACIFRFENPSYGKYHIG